ncbi:MAG: hypothetical protein JWP12_2094 [Bacteroidetes bacterium]|nr:hypothetical protein [Bacteroidota bacterium]
MLVLQKREKEGFKMLKNQMRTANQNGHIHTWEKNPHLSVKSDGTFFLQSSSIINLI